MSLAESWFAGASWADLVFDLTLGALLIGLAAAALYARQLYTGVMLFISFGLVLALVWARLGAVDLALAETAIGAGLTGVLFITALARSTDESAPRHRWWPMAGLLLLLAIPLWAALLPMNTPEQNKTAAAVAANLTKSGLEHPVSAVLLNFRAWDTLLEMLVLLLALLGIRQLRPASSPALPRPWLLLAAWGRLIAPLTLVVGGFLLWRGAYAPGGAFQAGALLAAGAVVLRLLRLLPELSWQNLWLRGLTLVGLAVFVCVGLATAFAGSFMQYPAGWAKGLILTIEVFATLSIAAALTLMVAGEPEELQA